MFHPLNARSTDVVPGPRYTTGMQTGRNPGGWAALWRIIIRVDRERIVPWIALRNTVGIVVPLAAGAAISNTAAGMIASMGAMNVSFSDGSDPYLLRARRMLMAAVLGAAGIAVGALSSNNPVVAAATATAWALGAGMLVALDAPAGDIGVLTLVMVLVFSGQPATPAHAAVAGLLALLGGLFQTALASALWPVRRYEPERRVLAALYSELARIPASAVTPTTAPPASAHATEARTLLSTLSLSRTVQGERYLSVLAQAERIRLGLLMLARVRTRWFREEGTAPAAQTIDEALQAASRMVEALAAALDRGASANLDPNLLPAIEMAAERLRSNPMFDDARQQIDALAGQLRSAAELASASTERGRAAFEQREEARPWRLRLEGTLAILRANLTLRSAVFRHAVRLAVCVLAGQAIAHSLGAGRSYWLPMTVAIVLKPDFTGTFTRGVLRIAGTYAGLVLATAIFHLLNPPVALEIALLGAFAFLLRCFGPANYGIFVTAISALIVLLFALIGIPPAEVIAERGLHTLLGGGLALVAYALWPTWERSHVNDTLAALLDSYRDYFRVVRNAYIEPERSFARELDRVRLSARLARSNAEASIERFAAEPGTPAASIAPLNAILASSHRLVHAMMALEAGLVRSRALPARDAFVVFANYAELTLYSLAQALRGSPLSREMLPDLREAHRALTRSGDPLQERYALVNVETDRLTNSLNTLTEQLLAFARQRGT
jgi:uncharacterized membrane protein YccC